MSRLLHDILKTRGIAPGPRAALSSAVRVDLQNVADYLYANPREYWTASEDIPSCAPPWDAVWGEYRLPRESNDNGSIRRFNGPLPRFGLLMSSKRIGGGGWALDFRLFMGRTGDTDEVGSTWRTLGPDGVCLPGKHIGTIRADLADGHSREAVESLLGIPCDIMLLAFAFCHCKNVVVRQEVAQDRESRQARQEGRSSPRWHVLEVGSEATVAKPGSAGSAHAEGRGVALHICRGHFARYTEEKPLFGRLVGTFWVPQHVKGAKEHGVVQKDYRVTAPTDPVVES